MFTLLATKKNPPLKRRVRAKPGQLRIYVAHLEQHELLRTLSGAVDDPLKHAELWESLTEELNACGLDAPRRTVKQWQVFLGQWKHCIRYEARQLRKQNLQTGSSGRLSDFKERALNLLGRKVVVVDNDDDHINISLPVEHESVVAKHEPLDPHYLVIDKDACRACMTQQSPGAPNQERRSIFDADNPILHLYTLFTSIEVSISTAQL